METMRKTIGETKAALEFMARIDELDKESRDHFRMVLLQLLRLRQIHNAVFVKVRDEREIRERGMGRGRPDGGVER